MEVYKFGGASLASPEGMERMGSLVARYRGETPLVVVVSAIGKTTNALEHALSVALSGGDVATALAPIEVLHRGMVEALRLEETAAQPVYRLLSDLHLLLSHLPAQDYDTLYDQVISQGELLSSLLFSALLSKKGLSPEWVDVRSVLRTYPGHRGAVIDATLSLPLVQARFQPTDGAIYVTQGFIASDSLGATTTLGREGSDYSAALLGCFLGVSRVTIWKDVEGLFNADPKRFAEARLIEAIDYREVIEMAYNGAKVIHEKALKPLQNADIPLYVRSFLTEGRGTEIRNFDADERAHDLPLIAVQEDQVLLTVSPRDLSFALQDYASRIFELVRLHHLTVRLVQNSAVRLSLSLDYDAVHFPSLLDSLQEHFYTSYNLGVVLVSLRHVPVSWHTRLASFAEYLLLQETRTTVQYLLLRSVWDTRFASLIGGISVGGDVVLS